MYRLHSLEYGNGFYLLGQILYSDHASPRVPISHRSPPEDRCLQVLHPPCGPDALGAEDVPDPTPAYPVGTNALYNGPPDGTTCTCPDAPGGMSTLFLSWDGVWLSMFAMKSSAVLPLLVNS